MCVFGKTKNHSTERKRCYVSTKELSNIKRWTSREADAEGPSFFGHVIVAIKRHRNILKMNVRGNAFKKNTP